MGHCVDLVAPQRSHDLTGSLETSFDENRPEEGLEGVGKNRLLLTPAALCLALAEDKIWSQPKLPCHACTGLPPHETIETAGKLSFAGFGVQLEKHVGHGEPQHPVSDELKPLVVVTRPPLRPDTRMGQRAIKKLAAFERVAQARLEFRPLRSASHVRSAH